MALEKEQWGKPLLPQEPENHPPLTVEGPADAGVTLPGEESPETGLQFNEAETEVALEEEPEVVSVKGLPEKWEEQEGEAEESFEPGKPWWNTVRSWPAQ